MGALLLGAALHSNNPRGLASKFLISVFALFSIIFIASYTANLAAFMITKEGHFNLSGINDKRVCLLNFISSFVFLATKQSFHLFTRKIFAYLYFTKSFSIQSLLVVAGMQEQILAHSGSAQYLAGPRRRQSGKISQKCSNI